MACTTKVSVKGEIDKVLADVTALAKKDGVTIKGTTSDGKISGKVTGDYKVSGKQITVNVSAWPMKFMVPCSAVQNGITNWFKGK